MPNPKDFPRQSSPIPGNFLVILTNPTTGETRAIPLNELLNAQFVPDTTPPGIVTRTVLNSTTIRIVFSEIVPLGSISGWSSKKNGTNNPILSVSGVGTATLDFVVQNAIVGGDAILISYNPASGSTSDGAGNEVGVVTDAVVANGLSGGGGGGDTTPPSVFSSTVENAAKNQIVVVFTESVSLTTAGWSFLKAGSNWPIVSVSGSGNTWTFTMTGDAAFGETLQRSYNPGTGNTLDGAGNELGSFTNQTVTNNVASGGSSFHPAAQNFFDANPGVLTGQRTAYNTFFQYLDDNLPNGLADIDAFWGFLFGNAANNKWNWMDPVDNNANHRAVFNGGVTHGSNFIQSNGTTGYVDLNFNPSSVLPSGNFHVLADYFDEDGSTANGGIVGNMDPTENFGLMIFPYLSSSIWGFGVNAFRNTSAPGTPYAAMVQVSRLSATNFSLYINGDAALTESTSDTTAIPTGNAFALALNKQGTGAVRFATCKLRFVAYGRNIDSSAASHIRIAITNLKTALGI